MTNTTDRFFGVYERVRNYLKEKKCYSISSIFLDENQQSQKEISLETSDFLRALKTIVKVVELPNMMAE